MQSSIMKSAISSRSVSVGTSGVDIRPIDVCPSVSLLRQQGKFAGSVVLRADNTSRRRLHGAVVVRADQRGTASGGDLDEKLKDLASEGAVESMQGIDRSARLMVDELKPVNHPGTTSPGELELEAEDTSAQSDESLGRGAVTEVASDSAVDPEHSHETAITKADEIAPVIGLSIEDMTDALEDSADKASERDAELLSTDKGGERDGGVGQVLDVGKESGVTGEEDQAEEQKVEAKEGEEKVLTRDEATEKVLDVAREGIEVLKWAAERIVSAGANSRQGLEVAKEIIDKRMQSFGQAAEETKEVTAELSEVAKKKYEELQGSASKFQEELQVNLEDKKAVEEDKPDSETNPLAKLSQGVQETIRTATKEDGPLAKLSQGVQENVAKLSSAGQELRSKAQDEASEVKDKVQDKAQEGEEKVKEAEDRLVPVGEKEGFFQDLAPASGASPKAGDRSTEASDILGSDDSGESQKEGGGFFGDLPVESEPTSSSQFEQSADDLSDSFPESEEKEQAKGGFFGDLTPETGVSSYASESQDEQPTKSSSIDSSDVKNDYEHEVGNEQLAPAESSESPQKVKSNEIADSSGDASKDMKMSYEHEVGNEQL